MVGRIVVVLSTDAARVFEIKNKIRSQAEGVAADGPVWTQKAHGALGM